MEPALVAALDRLADLIASSPHNLVARGSRDRLRETHVDECVRIAEALPLPDGARWLDLGTGGGLPGLVLALLSPRVSWTLVDSVGKKTTAVRGFAMTLGLDNVVVTQARAEELAWDPAHRGAFDGVVSRAVAPLPVLLELARGFLHDRALLVAVKGPAVGREVQHARVARGVLRYGDVHTRRIEATVRPTVVVSMPALGPPPRGYPRGVGVPSHAPLGGRPT